MAKYERSKIPLYISALAVAAGIFGHTAEEIAHFSKIEPFYSDRSLSYKAESFLVSWLESWTFGCLENPLWCIPTIAVLFQIAWLVNHIIHKKTLGKHDDSEKQKRSESKVRTVLFILSFLPMTLILLYSLYCSFGGYRTGFINTYIVYGAEAFKDAFLWTCLFFSAVPVLPLMLVWQIVYIVCRLRKK